jgi:hypothetical protein
LVWSFFCRCCCSTTAKGPVKTKIFTFCLGKRIRLGGWTVAHLTFIDLKP